LEHSGLEVSVFDPKNRIHWLAVIVIAIILILILGVTSTGVER
jgi:hypothetical protein